MTGTLTQIASFGDEVSAEALAGLLRTEGVPAEVRVISALPGIIDEVQVYVPAALAHRARWLMASEPVSDAELEFAATGKLPGEKDGR